MAVSSNQVAATRNKGIIRHYFDQDSSPPLTKLKHFLSVTLSSNKEPSLYCSLSEHRAPLIFVLLTPYNDNDHAEIFYGKFVNQVLDDIFATKPFVLKPFASWLWWSLLVYWLPASAERRVACSYPPCEVLYLCLPTREANYNAKLVRAIL